MEHIEIAKKTIKEAMGHMGFDAEIYERQEEGRVVFNIRCQDAKLLIGRQGSTLESLQYILKLLVYRQIPQEQRFVFGIDIDDYKDKRTIYLKDLARKAAHHVRRTKKPVSLVPMPSHERRVIHNYLSLFSDVRSESIGEDPNRKLIIKYLKPENSSTEFNFIEEM